jgi:predicted Zn-dependent protease
MAKTGIMAVLGLCLAVSLPPLGANAQGLAGPYLAAIQADIRNDYEAAARFYPQALAADPKNPVLLRGTLTSFIAKGDVHGAAAIAQRIFEVLPGDQIAALVLAADAVRKGDFAATEKLLENDTLQLNNLLRGLLLGWSQMAQGKAVAAAEQFDRPEPGAGDTCAIQQGAGTGHGR